MQGRSSAPVRDSHVPAWLVTVVTRLCIDRLRRRGIEAAWRDSLAARQTATPAGSSPLTPLSLLELADDARSALRTLLSRLSAEDCAVLLLHDVLELDHAELARLLGRSAAACRQALLRARRRLREPSRALAADPPDEMTVARMLAAIRDASSRAILAALGLRRASAASKASQPPIESICRIEILWRAGRPSLVVQLDTGEREPVELTALPLPLFTRTADTVLQMAGIATSVAASIEEAKNPD